MAKKQQVETVEPAGTELVVAGVGTLVHLDRPEEVAQALADIRALEAQLRSVKSELAIALAAEGARQGTKTMRFGSLTVKLASDKTIVWDIEELAKLLDAGLPAERYDALVSTEVTYKVSAAEAKRIAGANEVYHGIIERARSESEPTVRVQVS